MIFSRPSFRLPAVAAALVCGLTAASAALAASTPDCRPARGLATGLSRHVIDIDGAERDFHLYLPSSYSGRSAVPLVFDLQASGISPTVELQVTGLARAAERDGFVVVAPSAATVWPRGGYTWNVPPAPGGYDDIAFIADLLERLQGDLCIDTGRVYAVGYSGGGRLASRLACALNDRFAAISVVAGLRYPRGGDSGCESSDAAVPLLAFHSVDDPVNPYSLDGAAPPPYWRYGVEEALRRWAVHNGCSGPARVTRVAAGIERLSYSGCRADSVLEFYRLTGSGHVWPGSSFDFPAFVGAAEPRLDATALSLTFFQRFSLPSP